MWKALFALLPWYMLWAWHRYNKDKEAAQLADLASFIKELDPEYYEHLTVRIREKG